MKPIKGRSTAAIAFAILSALAPAQLKIYVSSEQGDDRNDGSSWSRSFRSVDRARQALNQLSYSGSVRVNLRGTFHLSEPLVIQGERITWAGDGRTVLSGSVPIHGWRQDTFNGRPVWSAETPDGLEPRQVLVGPDAERAPRPRLPETGFYRLAGLTGNAMAGPWNEGQREALFRAGDIPLLYDPNDVDLVAHQFWVTSRLPISDVDYSQGLVRFGKKSVFRLSDDYTGQAAPYYLDNVAEQLKHPGQWYWDRPSRRICYIPRPQDRLSTFQAEVPDLPAVVVFQRSYKAALENVQVRGAEWSYPADSSGDGQAATSVPGAIQIDASFGSSLSSCQIRGCGTYGIEVLNGSTATRIEDCSMTDLGGGGVKIGHGTSDTWVSDCRIEDDGKLYASSVGIWIGNSGRNHVTHNLIDRLGYTGISVGWTWGYGASNATENLIEWNDIHDIGQGLLSDMGGIYTLGVSPGTVLIHNRISNVQALGYGGWGIYLDEGSSQILVEDNLVTNCKTGSFHQHYGRDNLVLNNIFAFAGQDGQIIRSRPEDHNSFTMEHNLVLWKGTPLFGGNLQGPGFLFDRNILWKLDGKPDLPGFLDKSNLVADPLFVNPATGDFRFRQGSPAVKLGIHPVDMSGFGPRHKRGRPSLPGSA